MPQFTFSKDSPLRAHGEEDTVAMPTLRSRDPAPKDSAGRHVDPAGSTQPMSVLGKTLVFKGELTADEDLLIQGRIEGSITHTSTNLAIGTHGDVQADVTAQRLIVQGKLEGDVHATDSVTVEVSANVCGNIYAPRVGLKDGAKFRGSIDMSAGAGESRAPKGSGRRVKQKAEPGAAQVDEILG